MTASDDQEPDRILRTATIDFAIRLGFIALLGYWSFRVIAPFLTIALWSAILAVALYPVFNWLTRWSSPRAAAVLVTVLCLLIVNGPLTWLGLGMIGGVSSLVSGIDSGQLAFPLPPEAVKEWPIVGQHLHQLWQLSATNIKGALTEVGPMLKPAGGKLLEFAQGALFGLIELLVAIVIAGFLFTRGPSLVDVLGAFLGRVLSHRGKELVQLAGATIRSVSRGVVGIALLQSLLAGAGFLAAGIPAAGVLAFVAFLLSIVQIGPAILFLPIIVWSWTAMDTTDALMFTAYMIPVGLIDNVLRPVLMARGLTTPMPVIIVGVLGGTIAFGIVGLFFGPIVISVAWTVMVAWVQETDSSQRGTAEPSMVKAPT